MSGRIQQATWVLGMAMWIAPGVAAAAELATSEFTASELAASDVAALEAVPAYAIEISDAAKQRLDAHRDRIRGQDTLTADDRLWVPVVVVHAGQRHPARLRLRGDLPVHWRGAVQSYRLKFEQRLFDGRSEINLIVPWDKHYGVEWLQTRVAQDLGLLAFPGRFVDVTLGDEHPGLYYESEQPTREYLERHARPSSSIFTFGSNWTVYFGLPYHHIAFELPGSTTTPPVESVAQIHQRATWEAGDREHARMQVAYLLEFYELLTQGSVAALAASADLFLDLPKFARFVALQDFFGSNHGMALNDNTRLYLDSTSGKFEFIPWDTALGSLAKRAQEREVPVAQLLEPENPVFAKLFEAIPELRRARDAVLRELVNDGERYRRDLAREHARLQHFYPGDERLREQSERHDRVFRENLALLAGALERESEPRVAPAGEN